MNAGYPFEEAVRLGNSITPLIFKRFSNYLRQYVDFTIPPCIWAALCVLAGVVGIYWLYVAIRAKHWPA